MKRSNKRFNVFALLIVLCFSCTIYIPDDSEQNIHVDEEYSAEMPISETYSVNRPNSITDSFGNTYQGNILEFDANNDGRVTFDLAGKYSSFHGYIVASNETGNNVKIDLAFYADGRQVDLCDEFTWTTAPHEVNLDLTTVNQLSIMSYCEDNNNSYLYLVEPSFTEADVPYRYYPEWDRLCDQILFDSYNEYQGFGLVRDRVGNAYDNYVGLYAGSRAYTMFDIEGKGYETFDGWITTNWRTSQYAKINVEIYVDGVLKWNISNFSIKYKPQHIYFEDISNAKTITIEATSSNSDAYVFMMGGLLFKHQHEPGEWQIDKEPTCIADGHKKALCNKCGTELESEVIPKLGHQPEGDWIETIKPTCANDGKRIRICSVCGEAGEVHSIKRYPHTPSGEYIFEHDADCHHDGSEVELCLVCGQPASRRITNPRLEHQLGEWTNISGNIWRTPIIQKNICSLCQDEFKRENHSMEWFKPMMIMVFIVLIGIVSAIALTLKMNGLPFNLKSLGALLSRKEISDADIENILNDQEKRKMVGQ